MLLLDQAAPQQSLMELLIAASRQLAPASATGWKEFTTVYGSDRT